MRIFDCTTYYNEELMMDIRFHTLNDQVEKFIVVESLFSHSGNKKKLNFNINNYSKFKDKIIYLVIEKEPDNIKISNDGKINSLDKRMNSLKRIEQSYDYMFNGLKDAGEDDLILLSDNDEIPNLKSDQFLKSKSKVFIFKQMMFYYKFNLHYEKLKWFGSKGCKKKNLKNMSWLRNLKNKKYPLWRLDTFFSKTRYINLEIINDGGWHFTNLMTAEKLYEKLTNFGHHDEFELSGMTVNDLQKKIDNKEVFFNHFVDKEKFKERWNFNYKLKKIENNELPEYLQSNSSQLKYKDWFD